MATRYPEVPSLFHHRMYDEREYTKQETKVTMQDDLAPSARQTTDERPIRELFPVQMGPRTQFAEIIPDVPTDAELEAIERDAEAAELGLEKSAEGNSSGAPAKE